MSSFRIAQFCLLCLASVLPALAQPGTPATSVIGYPGAGVLQVGDMWESLLPQGFGPFYGEGGTFATEGARQFLRFGNFDRMWTTPNAHWPAAFPSTIFWSHYIVAQVYHPDSNFNPTKKGVAAPATGNWGQVTFKPTLSGADNAARRYSVEPYWVDGPRRQHAVYEAAWPTNIGCDVKVRAHAFSGPNWGHFNDFVIVEIEFKNAGQRDMNMDGVADAVLSNPDIAALTLCMSGEAYMSVGSYPGGTRNENTAGEKYTRMGGWIGDVDPEGNPWGFVAYYPGPRAQTPYSGSFNMGFNAVTKRAYTDIWIGWDWLAAKTGSLPADPAQFSGNLPDRNTIFGTHAIGTGTRRGWYLSAGSGGSLAGRYTDPRQLFTVAAGTFMKNGGAGRSTAQLDLSPNPNFFASGIPGDVTTWVPRSSPFQPNGDQKTLNTFEQIPYEDGVGYPTGWGKWRAGYNFAHDFNGDLYSGIGPLKIPKDSSVTVVLAVVGGYRLEGIQKAVRAARYVYANGPSSVPVLPAVPGVIVSRSLDKTIVVEWDSIAEADAGFGGYKVWRSTTSKKRKWLEQGIRLADRYQEQMTPGADRSGFTKPVNPRFDAFNEVNSSSLKGEYAPDTWGTWDLIAATAKTELAGAPRAPTAGYRYLYEDTSVVPGSSSWYYVAAYKEGSFSGPGGETTGRIETPSLNRNGASGLWCGTYPFAYLNSNFPRTPEGRNRIGAGAVIKSTVAYPVISFGTVNLGLSRDMEIMLRNSSDYPLNLVNVTDNLAFRFRTPNVSIPPGDSILTTIRYAPTKLGQESARCAFMRDGTILQDSLLVSGAGNSGTRTPQVAWESRDDSTKVSLPGPLVSIDAAGSVYSWHMVDNARWKLRKHAPGGGITWSFVDSVYSFGYSSRIIHDGNGNTYVAMAGSPVSGGSSIPRSVAKVSPGGDLLWIRSVVFQYNGPSYLSGIAVDQEGNVYTAGSSQWHAAGNSYRMTTTKFSPGGSVLWVTYQDGPITTSDSTVVGAGIAVDGWRGNVYVTGQTGSYMGAGDIVTVKYNSLGVKQWEAVYDGPSHLRDTAVDVVVATSGDVYVLGTSERAAGGNEIVLLKYGESDGAPLWTDRFTGQVQAGASGRALLCGANGDLFVAGSVTTVNNTSDGLLLRYSPAGARTTVLQYDGATGGSDVFSYLGKDRDGNVYASGSSYTASGAPEAVLFKFSGGGVLEWEGHCVFRGGAFMGPTSVAVGNTGSVAVGALGVPTSGGFSVLVTAFDQATVDVSDGRVVVPERFGLEQNYPNPFNPTTIIGYDIPIRSVVTLEVFDVLGRAVRALVEEEKAAGHHRVLFDASGLAAGVYFYKLQVRPLERSGRVDYSETRKLLYLR